MDIDKSHKSSRSGSLNLVGKKSDADKADETKKTEGAD